MIEKYKIVNLTIGEIIEGTSDSLYIDLWDIIEEHWNLIPADFIKYYYKMLLYTKEVYLQNNKKEYFKMIIKDKGYFEIKRI